MIPRKPKLDPRTRDEIALYSADDLRRLYQGGKSELVRLRGGIPTTDELKAEIQWRLWWESWRVWITLWIALIGRRPQLSLLLKAGRI